MGNEAFTEAQEKQIVEVIRATVAEVLRQQEAQRVTAASDASQAQGTGSRCEFFRRSRAASPFSCREIGRTVSACARIDEMKPRVMFAAMALETSTTMPS